MSEDDGLKALPNATYSGSLILDATGYACASSCCHDRIAKDSGHYLRCPNPVTADLDFCRIEVAALLT
jgi:hypothetical protein